MTDHYFSQTPTSENNPKTISFTIRGLSQTLKTDAGVFSKSGLDGGTRLLIEHVELGVSANAVDLGCGYGAVTSVLGQIYPDSHWFMVDVNPRAVILAQENTRHLRERVKAVMADGLSEALSRSPSDVREHDDAITDVILNPPIRAGKAVVQRLFREAHRALSENGSLWIVIQKKHGAPSVRAYLTQLFGVVEVIYKKSGYFVLRCRKSDQFEGL